MFRNKLACVELMVHRFIADVESELDAVGQYVANQSALFEQYATINIYTVI